MSRHTKCSCSVGSGDASGSKRKNSKSQLRIADVINHAATKGKAAKLTTVSIVEGDLSEKTSRAVGGGTSALSGREQARVEKQKAL